MWRILLVEDEPLISMMLEEELCEHGHQVVGVAATVEGGLKLIGDVHPDVAIVDFRLLDGFCYELIRELKRNAIPFVLLTGARIDEADTWFANVEVLTKPVDFDKLVAALAQLRPCMPGGSVLAKTADTSRRDYGPSMV